ncbi:MAG: integral rane sensor signal transduction histidine kinase [Fibrobacteres bacterium]|nr:integral rane sensor signal transduction histidine kinase [Fibrobacterota bacterium]
MAEEIAKTLTFTRSIFLKLLGIYLASSVLIVLMIAGFLEFIVEDSHHANSEKSRAVFAGFLAAKMDPGTDLAAGRKLSEEWGLDIAMEGPGPSWSTIPGLPVFDRLESLSTPIPGSDGVRIGRFRHHHLAVVQKEGRRIAFIFGKEPNHEKWIEFIPFLILSIVLVLSASYLLIRRLFQPLKELHSGFSEARQGNLNARVEIRRTDELGELSQSFNSMLTGIREVMRSKEQLLLDVSHELRSPLTRIKVSLEIEGEDSKDIARKNVRELEKMIHELLESARMDSPRGILNLEPVEMGSLVAQILAEYEFASPGIRFLSPDAGYEMDLDRERIAIVIRNVLENALKYSGHQSKKVEVSLQESINGDESQVVLAFRDFGPGIPQSDLAAIFEPFYRVDKSRGRISGGYGLGLSLCRKIMVAHGGGIDVSSVPGEGTTMRIVFNGKYGSGPLEHT